LAVYLGAPQLLDSRAAALPPGCGFQLFCLSIIPSRWALKSARIPWDFSNGKLKNGRLDHFFRLRILKNERLKALHSFWRKKLFSRFRRDASRNIFDQIKMPIVFQCVGNFCFNHIFKNLPVSFEIQARNWDRVDRQ
jgi:hypothetical protein